ncbi:unnamed protein product, partial [Taenia asiatica]|uniref:S1 motif domain-containing protein n=1 Tax=Taenia asiatica TaxID=60517 RepID=A0A0R3WH88_TAEAS
MNCKRSVHFASSSVWLLHLCPRLKRFTFGFFSRDLSRVEEKLFNDHFVGQVSMDIVVELQEGAIIRVADVMLLKAD